jgi:hypothetical protein
MASFSSRNTNMDDFFLDPITLHEHYLINKKWVDVTLNPSALNQYQPSKPQIKQIDNISNIIPSSLFEENLQESEEEKSEDESDEDVEELEEETSVKVLTVETSSIYLKLSEKVIDNIAKQRNLLLEGDFENKAKQLAEYDKVDPTWINSIEYPEYIYDFSDEELLVYALLSDISIDKRLTSTDDIRCYIKSKYYIKIRDLDGFQEFMYEENNKYVLYILGNNIGIPEHLIKFIEFERLVEYIFTEDININYEKLEVRKKRYDILASSKYKYLIKNLYNADTIKSILCQLSHPLEKIILDLDNYSDDQLINLLGMCVPNHINKRQYIIDNIVEYKDVITRTTCNILSVEKLSRMKKQEVEKYLVKLTDDEIFTTFGFKIGYAKRIKLIQNIMINVDSFIYPLKINPKCCINKETIINLTPVTELKEYVAYGTSKKYYVYDMYDLLGAFTENFVHPENTNINFSTKDILSLKALVSSEMLIKQIDNVLSLQEEKLEYDQDLMDIFCTLDDKDKIKTFLYSIFNIGMYMRKWKGPGYPYPIKEFETQNKYEPNDKVSMEISSNIHLLDEMNEISKNYCLNLRVCEYTNEGYLKSNGNMFSDVYQGVIDGKECIRVSSTKFIGTSYHYIRLLFKESIPNFDVSSLDSIS